MLRRYASLPVERCFRRHQYLARENECPDAIFRIEGGWACRFCQLEDGRRQITALYLPGDLCEPQWALGYPPTQPVKALTAVKAIPMPIRGMDGKEPMDRGLAACIGMTMERQAEWLVSLGRKSATERVAFLFCDIFDRMTGCGQTHDQQCWMPLTQIDIADMTGLTPVHINRTLKWLRSRGLVEFRSKWLRITDLPMLRDMAVQVRDRKSAPKALRAAPVMGH